MTNVQAPMTDESRIYRFKNWSFLLDLTTLQFSWDLIKEDHSRLGAKGGSGQCDASHEKFLESPHIFEQRQ